MQNWALRGEGLWYDDKPIFDNKKSYPAIIDTGSEDIAVPPEVLKNLVKKWKKDIDGIECS